MSLTAESLIETRKDGVVTHNIRVGGADKICVDKDNSTVYKFPMMITRPWKGYGQLQAVTLEQNHDK